METKSITNRYGSIFLRKVCLLQIILSCIIYSSYSLGCLLSCIKLNFDSNIIDFQNPIHFHLYSLPNNSTINPILYNVMSHRYRIAFRETLCSRKRGFYSSTNGFVRDQSSFRETTIAAAGRDHNYEGSQLVTARQKSLGWFLRCSK